VDEEDLEEVEHEKDLGEEEEDQSFVITAIKWDIL
jgi:hypothetical protein